MYEQWCLQIMIAPEGILPVLSFLKGHHNCMFWSLADIGVMDVPTRQYRFLVLVLICLTSLGKALFEWTETPCRKWTISVPSSWLTMISLSGSYFCYDNPAALQKEIKRDMQVDTTNFMVRQLPCNVMFLVVVLLELFYVLVCIADSVLGLQLAECDCVFFRRISDRSSFGSSVGCNHLWPAAPCRSCMCHQKNWKCDGTKNWTIVVTS